MNCVEPEPYVEPEEEQEEETVDPSLNGMYCNSLQMGWSDNIEDFFNNDDSSLIDPGGYYIVDNGVPTAIGMDALEVECQEAWADQGMDHSKYCCQLMRNV